MDYSPAKGSTSHILLLSDSVVQPSNSNSDTDVSTNTSVAATTPQESGTVVVNSRDRSGTIIKRPIWDHIPTSTGAVPNPLQLPQFHSKLLQPALVDYAITGSSPQNHQLIHTDLVPKLGVMVILIWIRWI